jgi:hypothetical protein
MPTLMGSAAAAAEMKPRPAIMPDARPRRRWRMLDMIFCLFPFALNRKICSQQEKPGLHKSEFSSYKADNHPRQLIPALTYFSKIIAKL